ncbi:hypothetical protein Bbelb_229970 [Branchiostoma belcheri]|nr:hypothetical protein Bbelb_229970 [Branchiostoma belcheri]
MEKEVEVVQQETIFNQLMDDSHDTQLDRKNLMVEMKDRKRWRAVIGTEGSSTHHTGTFRSDRRPGTSPTPDFSVLTNFSGHFLVVLRTACSLGDPEIWIPNMQVISRLRPDISMLRCGGYHSPFVIRHRMDAGTEAG